MESELMQSLQELREKNNLSQVELAQKLNVTQGAVSQWEKGECRPRTDKLKLLSDILNCSVDELLTVIKQ
jgi:transcriptional regulator with XRE-family HTH domain